MVFFNRRAILNGKVVASKKEADDGHDLYLREQAGEIVAGSIRTQVEYKIEINGVPWRIYKADFVYTTAIEETFEVSVKRGWHKREKKVITVPPGGDVIMDSKSNWWRAEHYQAKRDALQCYGIYIKEVE